MYLEGQLGDTGSWYEEVESCSRMEGSELVQGRGPDGTKAGTWLLRFRV